MKKYLLLAAFSLSLIVSTRAQLPELQQTRAGDTLVNTDTLTREFTFSDGYSGVIITPVVTKLSGTVAGTAYFYISPNGVDYPTAPADSLVLANSAGRQFPATGWRLSAPVEYKVKCVFITAGTQSYKTQFYILARKYAQNSGGPFGLVTPWLSPDLVPADYLAPLQERLDTDPAIMRAIYYPDPDVSVPENGRSTLLGSFTMEKGDRPAKNKPIGSSELKAPSPVPRE